MLDARQVAYFFERDEMREIWQATKYFFFKNVNHFEGEPQIETPCRVVTAGGA